jgi:hypothetical protein
MAKKQPKLRIIESSEIPGLVPLPKELAPLAGAAMPDAIPTIDAFPVGDGPGSYKFLDDGTMQVDAPKGARVLAVADGAAIFSGAMKHVTLMAHDGTRYDYDGFASLSSADGAMQVRAGFVLGRMGEAPLTWRSGSSSTPAVILDALARRGNAVEPLPDITPAPMPTKAERAAAEQGTSPAAPAPLPQEVPAPGPKVQRAGIAQFIQDNPIIVLLGLYLLMRPKGRGR